LALLEQPLLFDDLEDCNNVREVFLVVPTGVDGHAEVGCVRKLDLNSLSAKSVLAGEKLVATYSIST
jgi:hypothetical protein